MQALGAEETVPGQDGGGSGMAHLQHWRASGNPTVRILWQAYHARSQKSRSELGMTASRHHPLFRTSLFGLMADRFLSLFQYPGKNYILIVVTR